MKNFIVASVITVIVVVGFLAFSVNLNNQTEWYVNYGNIINLLFKQNKEQKINTKYDEIFIRSVKDKLTKSDLKTLIENNCTNQVNDCQTIFLAMSNNALNTLRKGAPENKAIEMTLLGLKFSKNYYDTRKQEYPLKYELTLLRTKLSECVYLVKDQKGCSKKILSELIKNNGLDKNLVLTDYKYFDKYHDEYFSLYFKYLSRIIEISGDYLPSQYLLHKLDLKD